MSAHRPIRSLGLCATNGSNGPAVVALEVGSNDWLVLQANSGIDPLLPVEALRLNDRIAAGATQRLSASG